MRRDQVLELIRFKNPDALTQLNFSGKTDMGSPDDSIDFLLIRLPDNMIDHIDDSKSHLKTNNITGINRGIICEF